MPNIPAQHRTADHEDKTPPELFRTPPQDLEAEQAALGSLLGSGTRGEPGHRFFAETLETGLRAEDYYRPAHSTIHEAICALAEAGEPVDPITVSAELTRRGKLAAVGGAPYLHACYNSTPSPSNGAHYAEIVRAKAYRRTIIARTTEVLQHAYSETGSEEEIRDRVEQILTELVAGLPGTAEIPSTTDDLWLDYVAEVEEIQVGRDQGLTYGFEDLDRVTSGMRPGNVTVVAAASGAGKSTLALNMAVSAAKTGAKTLFSSLEMSTTELMHKIAAAEAEIPLHHLTREGGLTDKEWDKLRDAGTRLFRTLPLRVSQPEGASLADILSTARTCVRADGLDLLVVDYLQLVETTQHHGSTREQAVAAVSRGLKTLANSLHCHVIALSQINDDGMMRESRAIKNDCSVLVRVEPQDPEGPRSGEVDLVIEKNRFGPKAIVTAGGQLHYSRFVDMAKV
ncbi:replicative DNA helicase [Streptomyces sp. NPDC001255]|uniref:replicative DNA helicase n=1 Tax=Streptomyces sp. NPDC001255 TaxID=3364550 RepID=UPI00367913DE